MAEDQRPLYYADPQAYLRKVERLMGDRAPLDVLADTPAIFASLLTGRSAETLQIRPFAGKWTVTEIVGHLLDTEWVFGYRTRAALCDDRPQAISMDQDRWVAAQEHNERGAVEHLAGFRALRNLNLALWRRLTPEELQRVTVHDQAGELSIGLLLMLAAGHDLDHVDQFRRYVAVVDEGLQEA